MSDQLSDLTILTLNIEGDRHLDKLVQFINEYQPTILTLQEVFERDAKFIASKFGYHYSYLPLSLAYTKTEPIEHHPWGLAILTKLDISQSDSYYYSGSDLPVQSFSLDKHPCDDCLKRGFINLLLTTKTGNNIRVITTKFTWTPDGKASSEQHHDLILFHEYLQQFTSFILAGDFNAPRGGEIYSQIQSGYKDWLPVDITSTIDPDLHKSKDLKLVVDTIFSTPDYQLDNIEVKTGLSDHCGIFGRIVSF